jgi:hypothetical protein
MVAKIVCVVSLQLTSIKPVIAYDLPTLTTTLLRNFVTVRFDRTAQLWSILDEQLTDEARARCTEIAWKGEALCVGARRNVLRLGLAERGYREFLDPVEADANGGWRIHLFLADDDAVKVVPQITDGSVSAGDPRRFDPMKFVERRLRGIERAYQRTGRWHWWLRDCVA